VNRRLPVNVQPLRSMTVDQLLAIAEAVALKRHDGHLSILRFTTHWKVVFGTPALFEGARDLLGRATPKLTLKAALLRVIKAELEAMR
jgi:hypothetical protein